MSEVNAHNLFMKIIAGEIPSTKVYEDDLVVAIEDINPGAPHHYLIIPREHIVSIDDLGEEHKELVGHIFLVAAKIARDKGFVEDGYRVVVNCGKHAGQSVFHIHFHLLAGRELSWPPG